MRLDHFLSSVATRRPRRTARLRLTILYSCLFLILGASLLTITYVLFRDATGSAYVYQGPNGNSSIIKSPSDQSSSRHGSTLDLQTKALHGSGNPTQEQLQAQAHRLETLATQQHDEELHQLLTQSGIALVIMSMFSVALGWLMAGRVLRPIRTITTAARNISATNLHERLALKGPDDELKELGDTFDDLIERLEGSFDAQRAFVANASHELRTPLARQRAVVQVALTDPEATIDSLRTAHERVLATGDQQERLIEALLTLTRGQAGVAKHEPFDLATVTDTVLQARQADAERRELQIDATLGSAPTSGDPHLVERLVVNLVDNALRHNVPHGRLEISTTTTDGHACLSITNDGPVVPPTELDRLFLPLQRLDTQRTSHSDGLGLGLSIVQAVADSHDATLTATARPEGGLDIEVRFPQSREPRKDIAP